MKRLLWILAVSAVLLVGGCSKEKPSPENDGAISLVPVMDKDDVLTRGTLYQNASDLQADIFHTYAYLGGTTDTFFDSDVRYSTVESRWRFHQESGYLDYYWPIEHSLDFFAFAPSDCGYVTVDNQTNPPTFTAEMPLTNTGITDVHQEDMKEFMYAYTSGKDKSAGPVTLAFNHPFSAIIFKVSQSHTGLTVNSITVGGIAYAGTCSFENNTPEVPVWNLENVTGDMTLTVGKTIPADVDFGEELCGPYLVLPQTNATVNKTVTIEFTWHGVNTNQSWNKVDGKEDTYTISGSISNDWTAGKIYTYSLDLGSSAGDVVLDVSVTDWKYVYEHVFEIE